LFCPSFGKDPEEEEEETVKKEGFYNTSGGKTSVQRKEKGGGKRAAFCSMATMEKSLKEGRVVRRGENGEGDRLLPGEGVDLGKRAEGTAIAYPTGRGAALPLTVRKRGSLTERDLVLL